MTKQEYIDWIHTAKFITTDYSEYDSNGNHYARDIFNKDGKFYAVEYGNGEVMPEVKIESDGRCKITDNFIAREVEEIKETIESTRYEFIK